MKLTLLLMVLFTLVTGVVYISKSIPTDKTESVDITTHSLPGNVVETRLKEMENEPVTFTKTVSKPKVNSKRVVYFNDVFEFDTVQVAIQKLKKLESESSDPIYLLIDSPGGSVLDGKLLAAQMEASKAPVYTVCTRLCASMAAMLHSYGVKRYSLDGALLMYHPASAGVSGQVPNMMSQLSTMSRYVEKMVANVVKRSQVSKQEYDSLVAYEIWIDAEDSLQKGLIDGIVSLNVPSHPVNLSNQTQLTIDPNNTKFYMISPHLELWKNR